MSRGWGRTQRELYCTLMDDADKPLTFGELIRAAYPAAFKPGFVLRRSIKRSARRALNLLVEEGYVHALGKGGRADPHRYCMAPTAPGFAPRHRNLALRRRCNSSGSLAKLTASRRASSLVSKLAVRLA
jgi:hypothetical protein